jgi:hypothetical protein
VPAYLKTPDAFRNIVDQHVSPADDGSQPECGMIILFTTTDSPSSIIDLFRSCIENKAYIKNKTEYIIIISNNL